MKYERIKKATFHIRPNRFEAVCEVDGEEITVHVCNTGRCAELLVQGCTVYLTAAPQGSKRKTAYDLVAVEKICQDGRVRLINMDSYAPNRAAFEWYCARNASVRREVPFGRSRIDLCIGTDEGDMLIEVKGVTLEREGIALFPDAPTERGRKHLKELIAAKGAGMRTGVLFVIQMENVQEFRPNSETDPEFARLLKEARDAGVEIEARCCKVTLGGMEIDQWVPVHYEE